MTDHRNTQREIPWEDWQFCNCSSSCNASGENTPNPTSWCFTNKECSLPWNFQQGIRGKWRYCDPKVEQTYQQRKKSSTHVTNTTVQQRTPHISSWGRATTSAVRVPEPELPPFSVTTGIAPTLPRPLTGFTDRSNLESKPLLRSQRIIPNVRRSKIVWETSMEDRLKELQDAVYKASKQQYGPLDELIAKGYLNDTKMSDALWEWFIQLSNQQVRLGVADMVLAATVSRLLKSTATPIRSDQIKRLRNWLKLSRPMTGTVGPWDWLDEQWQVWNETDNLLLNALQQLGGESVRGPTRLPILRPDVKTPFVDMDGWFEHLPLTNKCNADYNIDEVQKLLLNAIQTFRIRSACVLGTTITISFFPVYSTTIRRNPKIRPCLDQSILIVDVILTRENRAHSNALIINRERKEYERFEPHGTDVGYPVEYDRLVNEYLAGDEVRKEFGLQGYTYLAPLDYCLQKYESYAEYQEEKKRCDAGGFCLTWSLYYMLLRILNPRASREEVLKEAMNTTLYGDSRLQKIRRFQSLMDALVEGRVKPREL